MKVFVSTQRKIIASAIASTFIYIYHRDNVKNMINQTQSHVKTVILKLTMMFA